MLIQLLAHGGHPHDVSQINLGNSIFVTFGVVAAAIAAFAVIMLIQQKLKMATQKRPVTTDRETKRK